MLQFQHADLFERIYRDVCESVCFHYSLMAKVSLGMKDFLDSKVDGQLQALFTVALHMDVEQETLDEIRAMALG
ncbi:hypothetical protein [Desulfoscipio gibsoniae]|uniref:Uncharacterized protein n=1 Tax=Desulfoscipio gibsoniae DSM 7213 TaxID=767817 RepID=R4KD88_9FIRM|nr:hypothetical protein [Desulfoscipio gibsoniae]AGK99666.1 hypothetical protein Desgi_0046 [Desulfoscipio gibsoniae DSM 7213]